MIEEPPNGHRAKWLNTVLVGVLIALIGGLLREVISHGKAIAKLVTQVEAVAKRIGDLERK